MGISSLIYDSWKKEVQFKKYEGMLPMLEGVNLRGKVLDVGIGTALFEEFLKGKGIALDVIGIDPDLTMLNEAKKRGYNVSMGTAEKLPFEDSSFDFVVCLDAIHATQERKALSEMTRVLRPGGHLLLSRFCNVFNKNQMMDDLLELVTDLEMTNKAIVGRSDDELSAVVVCRK